MGIKPTVRLPPDLTREEALKKVHDRAYHYEGRYGGCTQAVMSAFHDVLGDIPVELVRGGHGFAGGGALSGDGTCGALSGGFFVISFYHGRDEDEYGIKGCGRSYRLSKKLFDRFKEHYGSPVCREVQEGLFGRSFDIWDRDDYEEFERQGAHLDKCTSISGNVARWTLEILLDFEEHKNNG